MTAVTEAVVHGTPVADGPDVVSLVAEVAATRADAVAVRDGDRELTFGELVHRVDALACDLAAAGVGPGSVVVVEVPRSWREAVAVLAVLRAGASYTAVDGAAPEARAAAILAACSPAAVLGEGSRATLLADLADCALVASDGADTGDAARAAVGLPSLPRDPASTAYIAFTSGSTGEPKGVVVPHRAVTRLALGAPEYAAHGAGQRYLRLAPLAFDASTFELFVPLTTGATIEVHPPGPVAPLELAAFLRDRQVTVAWLTAGLFRLVAKEAPHGFDTLTQLITGGDVVPADQVRSVLGRRAGDLVVTNGYGPTESTTFATTCSVRDAADLGDTMSIGRPVGGTRVLVVDADLAPVAQGAAGELLVAGSGLATRYLGRPDADAAAFVTPPGLDERYYRTGDQVRWDGTRLTFLGRTDRQVKIRGHRVELTEVESALRALPGVSDAAAAYGPLGDQPTLVAAVVPADPAEQVDPDRLRAGLGAVLPGYMVPARVVVVPALPLTANGKVDLDAVLAAATSRTVEATSADAGTDAVVDFEAFVEDLWVEVLGHDDFGPDEGFFDVGGDSLLAATLHTRLAARLPDVQLKVVDIFRHPTVNELAAHLRSLAS